ncbi:S49 family peptidase [Alcaligenes faecalis]|nr:S49 family peptidase [Alcaligenes faecalis]
MDRAIEMSEQNTENQSKPPLIELNAADILKEHRKERRWIYGLRFLRTIGFLMATSVALILALRPNVLPWEQLRSNSPHTAVIDITGVIENSAQASLDTLQRSIQSAFENELSEAVVFRINSPGGSAVQASLLYEEIMLKRSEYPNKPVYAVIEDLGVSGGYFVAMAADKIYANQASLVGSIGVISSGFGFTGLMEKLGVERRTMTSGHNKALMDPFAPLTLEHREFWQTILTETHNQFISLVQESRGERLKVAGNTDLFSGLVWNGARALELGLIDGLRSVSSVALDVVGHPKIVDYTPRRDMFSRFAGRMSVELLELLSRNATNFF